VTTFRITVLVLSFAAAVFAVAAELVVWLFEGTRG
jgi:hypothetical protein